MGTENVQYCRKFWLLGRCFVKAPAVVAVIVRIAEFLAGCNLFVDQVEKTINLTLDSDLYLGLGKSSTPEFVNRLNNEFEEIKKNHELQKINSKWKSIVN